MRLDTPTSSPQHLTVNSESDEEIMQREEEDTYHLALDEDADELVEVDEEEFERLNGLIPGQTREKDEEFEKIYPTARKLRSSVVMEHMEPVFSANFDPSSQFVVTASQADIATVWTAMGDKVFDCSGHEESVVEAKFNFDGTYVATADLNGCVKVWKTSNKALHDEYQTGDEIQWMSWHPAANVLFAGCTSGASYMWRLPMTQLKILYGHGSATNCGMLLPDGKRLVVGYTDGQVTTFDLKAGKELHSYKHPDNEAVTCMDVYRDNNLIAAAFNQDGIVLIKATNGTVVGTLKRPDPIVPVSSVTAEPSGDSMEEEPSSTTDAQTENESTEADQGSTEEFEKDSRYIESIKFGVGLTDGILAEACGEFIHLWDFTRQVIRHSIRLEGEVISRMVWHKEGLLFVAGVRRNTIYGIEGRSGKVVVLMTEHEDPILDVTLSADQTKVLSSSDDCTARIFNLDNLSQIISESQIIQPNSTELVP